MPKTSQSLHTFVHDTPGGANAVGLGALAGAVLGALTGLAKTLTRAIQHLAMPCL